MNLNRSGNCLLSVSMLLYVVKCCLPTVYLDKQSLQIVFVIEKFIDFYFSTTVWVKGAFYESQRHKSQINLLVIIRESSLLRVIMFFDVFVLDHLYSSCAGNQANFISVY